MTASIAERFRATANRVAARDFIVSTASGSAERLSYGAALRRAEAFARQLRDLGAQPGDRIVLNCGNSLDYVCAYFGTWFAQCTVVPVDEFARPPQVNGIYRDCAARFVVTAQGRTDLDPDVRQLRLQDIVWDGAAPAPYNDQSLAAHLPLIIYTSGTTGSPKGVCLSHGNLDYTRAAITDWAGVTEDDRELTTLSLTHLFGLGHLHVYSALGGTICIGEGLRDVPRLLDVMEVERITSFPGTPAGMKILLDRFADAFREKGRGLRYIVINTAPMPVPYTERLLALLPDTRIYMYYGLTEASRSTYISHRDHPEKIATVGRPPAGAQVSIGDPAQPLVNEPGEILVRGPHVTSGYWAHEADAFFEDGWFRTGDLGSLDADGFLTWIGRVRDQINVDGLKLVPSEVEAILRLDSRVADCAVVGLPDPLSGESVAAFVVLAGEKPNGLELELRKLCSAHLEAYKVPRRVLIVNEIPKTDTGKIKRYLLRSQR